MKFDVSVALTWILFLALFPMAFFWFRRAWRAAVVRVPRTSRRKHLLHFAHVRAKQVARDEGAGSLFCVRLNSACVCRLPTIAVRTGCRAAVPPQPQ